LQFYKVKALLTLQYGSELWTIRTDEINREDIRKEMRI